MAALGTATTASFQTPGRRVWSLSAKIAGNRVRDDVIEDWLPIAGGIVVWSAR